MQAIDNSWGVHEEDRVHVEFVKAFFLEVRFFFSVEELGDRRWKSKKCLCVAQKKARNWGGTKRLLCESSSVEHFNIKHDHLQGKNDYIIDDSWYICIYSCIDTIFKSGIYAVTLQHGL